VIERAAWPLSALAALGFAALRPPNHLCRSFQRCETTDAGSQDVSDPRLV